MFEQLVKDIIREVFAYKDMQDYLCEHVDELTEWQIVNIVRRAFIPLTRKLEMFEALAVYEDIESVDKKIADARVSEHPYDEMLIKENSYYYQAQFIKEALEHLDIKDKSDGLLLLIEYQECDGIEQRVGELPFYSYEKLLAYVKEYMEVETLDELHKKRYWCRIEKYEETSDGDLEEVFDYCMFDETVVYCSGDEFCMSNCYEDLNVPVPFKQGDVIACDGGPTCEDTVAVIIRTGDNIDCCSLVALCKRDGNILEHTPVKHSSMFYDTDTAIFVPPLFSIRCINDELSDEDVALKRIGEFVNGDEDRGYIVECIHDPISMDDVTDSLLESLEQNYQDWKKKIKARR